MVSTSQRRVSSYNDLTITPVAAAVVAASSSPPSTPASTRTACHAAVATVTTTAVDCSPSAANINSPPRNAAAAAAMATAAVDTTTNERAHFPWRKGSDVESDFLRAMIVCISVSEFFRIEILPGGPRRSQERCWRSRQLGIFMETAQSHTSRPHASGFAPSPAAFSPLGCNL